MIVRLALLLISAHCLAQVNVLSYHNDLARTGQNLNETILTPASVASPQFGKRFSFPVDGQIYAQPLYVSNVPIAGVVRNVVYVVTEHDSAYAFDADGNTSTPLWQRSFLVNGAVTVPNSDVNCGQIAPEIGITDTPAIDPVARTMYFVAMTKESGNYLQRLHALDIATGAERPGSPVVIQGSASGTGDGGKTVTFIPKNYKERSGLLLLNGIVYTSWASHCDEFLYHGWVMGYDAQSLQQVSVYVNTPNGHGASFWTSGAAPSVDQDGKIYVNGGNGDFDGNSGGSNLGESLIKLTAAGTLAAADYFTPFNYAALNSRDLDTGSSGIVLLPDAAGSAEHPHLLISAGKEGRIYVLDRDNMGKFQAGSDSQIVQSFLGLSGGLFGIPAFFNNTVYFSASGDNLKAFPIGEAKMATSPSSQSALKFGGMGGVPAVSANSASNGIVWMLQNAGGPGLYAYDATDLSKLLYNSNDKKQDALGYYVKFSTPTVANGRVYAGTNDALVVYGLASTDAARASSAVNSASYQPVAAPGSLISIFGVNFTSGPVQASSFPLPNSLGGVSVTIGGSPAPLYFAGPAQINAQVPADVPLGPNPVVVSTTGGPLAPVSLTLQAAAPAIFRLGENQYSVVNATGALNSTTEPAPSGTAISVYLTGIGTGAPLVSATVGGVDAQVGFAGLSPVYPGLAQVNLVVPPSLTPGTYPLVVNAGGVSSNTAQLWIGP